MAGQYNLGTAVGRIIVDGAGAELGFGIAEQAGKEFFDAIKRQLDSLKDFGQNMMKAGAVGAAGFALAGNAAANYEERLSAVKAVSGASADEMKLVSDAALKIGADTSFSATQAAQAFEELVKAGISVQDSLDGAALATANLAAAGEIALPRAAEISANAMNNFNLAGKDMPHIADLIAGAANASAISVEEFASSLSQVGAVANLSGLSFDDTAVAIAEMGNAGIKGSDAGTSLKTMLMNLIPVTDAQINKFQEMGLMTFSSEKALRAMAKNGITPVGDSLDKVRQAVSDYLEQTQGIKNDTKEMGKAVDDWLMSNGAMQNAFFDTNGKVKSLSDMQEVLKNSTKDMTQEQKLANLETLFGADAIRGAAVMAKEGSAGYNELAQAMGKVTAADVAATRLDNVKGSIEKLKGAFETLLIQLGTVFLPIVKKVIDGLTEFVSWLTTMSDRARNFWVALGGISTGLSLVVGALATTLAVLGPFLIKMAGVAIIKAMFSQGAGAVLYFRNILADSSGPITFFMRLQARMHTLFVAIRAAAIGAAAQVSLFGKILAIAMGPWGKVAMVVAGLVALGVTLYNTWQPFTDLVDGIGRAIGDLFNGAMAAGQSAIDQVSRGFQGLQAASDPVSQLFFGIGQVLNVLWQDFNRLAALFQANVVPALQELWGVLQQAFGDAFAKISAVVQSDLMPALKRLGDTFFNDLFPALQKVGEFLLPIIGFVLLVAGAMIGTFYQALFQVASFIIGTVLPAIIQFAGPALSFLIDALANIGSFLVQYLITPFVNFITFLVGTVIPAVIDFGSMLFGAIGTAFSAVADAVGVAVRAVGDFIGGIVDFFTSAGNAAGEGVTQTQNAFGGLVGFFTDLGNGIVTAVSGWITGIVTTVTDGFNAVLNFISPVTNLIGAIVSGVWGVIYAIISGVSGLIVAVVQFLWGSMVLYFQTQAAILLNQWNTFWAAVGAVIDTIVNYITTAWNNFWATVNAYFVAAQAILAAQWNAFWTGLMAFLQPILDWFATVIPAAWQVIVGALTAAQQAITDTVTGAWNNLMSFIGTVVQAIQTLVAVAWNQITAGIQNAMQAAQNIVASIWQGIQNLFQSAVNWIDSVTGGGFSRTVNSIRSAMQDMVSAVSQKIDEIRGFFDRLPGTIQAIFAGAGTWLYNAGKSIIEGFLNGLRGMADDITNFFKDITAKIPQIKGPPQHDKVMLIPAGKMIMQSLWRGLDDGKDAVYDLLNNMNATIPATLDAALNPNLQAAIDGQLSGKASFTTINKAPIVNVAPAKVTANWDAKLYLGNKDITDLVDLRVEEHLEETASLIETGVL